MAKCTDVPELFGICYKLYGTISLVYSFTDTPSKLLIFPPDDTPTATRAHRRGGAGTDNPRRPPQASPSQNNEPNLTYA